MESTQKQKEQARVRKQRQRDKDKGNSVTSGSVTQERDMVPASYVQGVTGRFKSLPKRPRFLKLSDGQTLDRLEQPKGNVSEDFIQRMRACNESAYNFKPNQRKGLRS